MFQPVTQGEVDKAARISPLALCLVKPPAPELLHSMPVRDQRQLLADWAEATNLASTLIPLSKKTATAATASTRDEGTVNSTRFIVLLRGVVVNELERRTCDSAVAGSNPGRSACW